MTVDEHCLGEAAGQHLADRESSVDAEDDRIGIGIRRKLKDFYSWLATPLVNTVLLIAQLKQVDGRSRGLRGPSLSVTLIGRQQ